LKRRGEKKISVSTSSDRKKENKEDSQDKLLREKRKWKPESAKTNLKRKIRGLDTDLDGQAAGKGRS